MRLLLLIALAGCGASNATILRELAERAQRNPDSESDQLAARGLLPFPLLDGGERVTLPFLPGDTGVVAASVNGREMSFLVDSGSTAVWLPARAARRAGVYVPHGATHEAISPGYLRLGRLGVVDSIGLGGLRFGKGAVVIQAGRERSRDGVLGCAVLSLFRVSFDYRAREVRLEPHGGGGHTGGLFANVRINGTDHLLLVDSGANRIYLEPWAAGDLGLISEKKKRSLLTKADRAWRARIVWVELEKVDVAGRPFKNVKAGVVNTFEGLRLEGRRIGGVLGLSGFGPLTWTLDFGARTLRVEG